MTATRRSILLVGLTAALVPRARESEAAVRAVPVVDLSVHLPFQVIQHHRGVMLGSGQADAVRLRRGGAYGVVLPLERWSASAPDLEASYLHLYRALARTKELRIPGCRRTGPGIRTWFAIRNASEIATHKEVPLWVTRGVRFFGLASRDDSVLAGSALGRGERLSPRGRQMVRAIHAARGTVDVSGLSESAIVDVVGMAAEAHVPVVASHAGARALTAHANNLSDTQILAVARSGGLIGVSFEPRMLHRGKRADLGDVVRHVRHIARVGGVDHVAVGSGFEAGLRPPHELINASRYPRLAVALHKAGMPMLDVRKVMAGNALRLLCYRRPEPR